MTRERDQARTTDTAKTDDDEAQRAGRATRTDGLMGPHGRHPSRLVLRKAERDDNGVAPDAAESVAAASGSTGAALPDPIQRKFESSLGVDLSGVRVHSGGASMTAAHAVGAKAYTVGQDIHFGAGHYDPSSASGEHLLAHEVAHTVQQRGGSPVRQNKLEVSSPQDAAEYEADRAADAMVGGVAFGLAGTTSALSRKPDPKDAYPDLQLPVELRGVANPRDPYQQPPVSWDTMFSAAPDMPPAWAGIAPTFPAVLPRLDANGTPTKVEPQDLATKTEADARFLQDMGVAVRSWGTIATEVPAYKNAEKEMGVNGLGDGSGNLHWQPGRGGADMGQLAESQKVGPVDGQQTTIGGLFDARGNLQSTPQVSDPQKKAALQQLYHPVDTALSGVNNARFGVTAAHGQLQTAAALRKQAETSMRTKNARDGQTESEAEMAKLRQQTDQANSELEGFATVVDWICKASEGVSGMVAVSVSAMAKICVFANDVAFDVRTAGLASQIKSFESRLATLAAEYVVDAYATAAAALNAANNQMIAARGSLKTACANYQDVWDAFARAAGQRVGGSDGAQLQAILEAIPRAELVLAKVNQIIDASSGVPSYTPPSGIGFNAAGTPTDMPLHVSWLKSYRAQFTPLAAQWTARIASLRDAEKQATGTGEVFNP